MADMPATAYAHIELDERGVPRISGTRMKVRQIALEHTAWNMDAEKIQEGHPHLSLSSVHSALAYYYDHKAEIEEEIAAELARVDAFFAAHPPSAAEKRLKAMKSVIRFYIDHHVHSGITEGVRSRGVDCLTAEEDSHEDEDSVSQRNQQAVSRL